MRLTCPKCQAKSVVPDERVPQTGAWARCPKCRERFFIKPLPLDLGAEGSPAPSAARPSPAGRSPEAQKLLDRLRARNHTEGATSLEGPAEGLEVPTVFPEKTASPLGCIAPAAVLTLAALIFLFLNFRWASERAPEAPAMTRDMPPVYSEENLITDLKALKRKIARQNFIKYEVAFSGMESRVFKHFLAQLAPEMCQDIIRVDIFPLRGGRGFMAEAACLDDRQRSPRIEVRWEGREAVISRPERLQKINILMYPPTPKPEPEPAVADQ